MAEVSGDAPGVNAGPKTRFAGKDRKRPCALADSAFLYEADSALVYEVAKRR